MPRAGRPLRGSPAAAPARTHLRPPRPRVPHGAVRACRVPSEPAGCRPSRGAPAAGEPAPNSTRSLLRAAPPAGVLGAGPRPGPRARPAPAPAESTAAAARTGTRPRGRDGHPRPAPAGREEPREAPSELKGSNSVISAQLCCVWWGFEIGARCECRFYREHGFPLRGRTLQEREARVPTVTEKLRLARETD